jgi:Na+-transporting NADH:ubiquinone oxidoreductase subunit C
MRRAGPSWRHSFKALPNDSPLKTLLVTVAVALVGSILVTTSAVLLRPLQLANKEAESQKHFADLIELMPRPGEAAAIADGDGVEARVVDLQSGDYVPAIDPLLYDQRQAAKDPAQMVEIPPDMDVAGLKARARYALVYLVREDGKVQLIVLPVRGRGYASMLYGYLALRGDANTVAGLSFYEHAETPGLGALIDAPDWKAQWRGKKVRDPGGVMRLGVGTGIVVRDGPEAPYQVDGMTGATWTGNGVTNLLHYWLGDHGFGPYLRKLRQGEG